MTQPRNTKPDVRPICGNASEPANYQKLPAAAKRSVATARQREAPVTCPTCGTAVMPAELAAHQTDRCSLELPLPHPASRWLDRVRALRYAPSSRLDAWVERGIVRQREDGAYLERDLAIVTAWARALEAL